MVNTLLVFYRLVLVLIHKKLMDRILKLAIVTGYMIARTVIFIMGVRQLIICDERNALLLDTLSHSVSYFQFLRFDILSLPRFITGKLPSPLHFH